MNCSSRACSSRRTLAQRLEEVEALERRDGGVTRDDATQPLDQLVERQSFFDEGRGSGLDARSPNGAVRFAGQYDDVDTGRVHARDKGCGQSERAEVQIEQDDLGVDPEQIGFDRGQRRDLDDVGVDAMSAQRVGRGVRKQFVVVDDRDPRARHWQRRARRVGGRHRALRRL